MVFWTAFSFMVLIISLACLAIANKKWKEVKKAQREEQAKAIQEKREEETQQWLTKTNERLEQEGKTFHPIPDQTDKSNEQAMKEALEQGQQFTTVIHAEDENDAIQKIQEQIQKIYGDRATLQDVSDRAQGDNELGELEKQVKDMDSMATYVPNSDYLH